MGHDGNEERKTAASKWISTSAWLRQLLCIRNVIIIVLPNTIDMISDKVQYYIPTLIARFMGPTWGPHVGHVNLAIWEILLDAKTDR